MAVIIEVDLLARDGTDGPSELLLQVTVLVLDHRVQGVHPGLHLGF